MLEIYRDGKNLWHWRMIAPGKAKTVIAQSGAGFAKRSALLKSLERIRETLPKASIIEAVDLRAKAPAKAVSK